MSLPLFTRATEDGVTFVLTPDQTRLPVRDALPTLPAAPASRMPLRPPGPDEQYRFHVDMRKCIGCKCCVVACNEQNGNPAAINWRRVSEIEGGWYPRAQRSYMSIGCHHCLEPTCLLGCPVDAYKKDAVSGIVLHSADACIGCRYCTWNCSYGVPQYNPERGVVGKCDMCHGRLELGQSPACVSACPSGAIRDRDRQRQGVAHDHGRGVVVTNRFPLGRSRASQQRASPCRRASRRTRDPWTLFT